MLKDKLPYFYLASSMLLVGTSVVAGKVITNTFPIFISSFFSLLVASIMFSPFLLKNKVFLKLKKSDLFYLFLQALFGTVLYRIFLFISLKYVDASYAGILIAFQPAMIALLAIIFLKEKQSLKQIFGLVLAITGLLITYLSHSLKIEVSSGLFLGTFLMFLSMFCEACFIVFAKKLNSTLKPMDIAGMVAVLSTVMMIPLLIFDLIFSIIQNITLTGIIAIFYYGVFLTFVPFIFWFKGSEKVKAGVSGIFTALVSLSGIFFSALLLKDFPNLFEIIGAFLIILSIIFVVYKNEK